MLLELLSNGMTAETKREAFAKAVQASRVIG
jgi:hypothetical protein